MNAAISIVTATTPRRLSKAFSLDGVGALTKQPGGVLVDGTIKVQAIASLDDLASVLGALTPGQALTHGVPLKSATRVMSTKAHAAAGKPADATTRTNAMFKWPDGPGVMMLDYDAPGEGEPLDRETVVATLRVAAPALADAAMLWWPSASSCIWHGETELRGVYGQRLYILVQEAADIPRAGAALVDRLWLDGHGRFEVSKSGQMLPRTLVDGSVWQASRLDFAGGAECANGLEQRRGDPVLIEGVAEFIDTRAALPDLTPAERERLTATKAEAKAAAQPDAEIAREEWISERVAEMVAPEDRGDPEAIQAAETVARRALESGVLAGDFLLHVEIAGKVEAVPVGELLDNRERFHNCRTRDPLEPDYDGARLVGRLYLMQARPTLHSFAHGGKTFKLHRAPARIEIVRGQTSEATSAAIERLRADPVSFDFGGQLALAENGRLWPLDEHGLAHHLGSLAQFWKWTQRGDNLVPQDCDPPPALLKQVLALGERRELKPLAAVITGPTIRPDGSLLATPGYDQATRLLFDPAGEAVPVVPVHPTMEQARAALGALWMPVKDFPYVDVTARGAMLAALLTAAVRAVLPTSPAFAFDAPIQASGKTLAASSVGALAEGRAPDVWPHTHGRDDEEVRKRLFTALRTGNRALIWDNVVATFDSASMAAFITADAMIDRVLGKSESIRIPNRALFLLTGNNLSLAGDLPRRVMICRIDPETDQPFARVFDLDPLAHTLENRMALLAAACTLIRARFTHAMELAPGKLASFEAWDYLVRQTVCWIDTQLDPGMFGDPMTLVRKAQAADPEADMLFALLDALRERFGNADGFLPNTELADALCDIGGDRAVTSSKSLGRVLKNREGRIVHGLRLVGRRDMTTNNLIYRVEVVDGGERRASVEDDLGAVNW